MCHAHYMRWYRNPDSDRPRAKRIKLSLIERFINKIEVIGDCWRWTGTKNTKGYGRFRVKYKGRAKDKQAHRWAYEHFLEPIPKGMVLDHMCRHRDCVFPGHLKPVTHMQNTIAGLNGGRAFHFILTGKDIYEGEKDDPLPEF